MQKTKRKPNTIRAKQKFYDFCVRTGIDLKNLDVHNLQIHEIPPKRKSTFKNRSAEIKSKFNYTFKTLHQDFMCNYPNINNLTFIKK